jgi:ureidoacrylate peracid hydrolase
VHRIDIAQSTIDTVTRRCGRRHPFDRIDAKRTALVVIDMQNHFMKPGFMNATPTAIEIVPAVNRLAAELRARGGHVVWIKNSTNDTRESWSVFHEWLMTPERAQRRTASMDEAAEGHQLWDGLDVQPQDAQMVKKRFSAFIQGSSDIERHLRARGLDTVLVTGTATQVCCESTARDAAMLNFKTLMIADACATDTDELHNASLNAFNLNFGDVQTVDEVLASMDHGAAASVTAKAAGF